MAEGPIYIIMDMIMLVLQNTVSTVLSLLGLSGNLMESISALTMAGGGLGLVIVLFVILIVGFFVVKFIFKSMKLIGILILVGLGVLAFIFIGSALI